MQGLIIHMAFDTKTIVVLTQQMPIVTDFYFLILCRWISFLYYSVFPRILNTAQEKKNT